MTAYTVKDFEIGATYRIVPQAWESPFGETVPGETKVRTVFEPAGPENTVVAIGDGHTEAATRTESEEWRGFLRVMRPDNGKFHLIEPGTIEHAERLTGVPN